MSRRRGDDSPLACRIADELREAPVGLHDIGDAGTAVPDEWPDGCKNVYTELGHAQLFSETLVLLPAAQVEKEDDRWRFGHWAGDDLWFDARGRVWRFDPSLEAALLDGTALDRWLAGAIDAISALFDGEGEYFEAAFDEDGELAAATLERMARAQLRRDSNAPAPRWRLAAALAERGQTDAARNELEHVVAQSPTFAWGWLDLARMSEALGETLGARDEALAAAEAAETSGDPSQAAFAGYFWAQAARLCAKAEDESGRSAAAASALRASPNLVREHLAGARAQLADGDLESVRGLLELARSVAPRDLDVLALGSELTRAESSTSPESASPVGAVAEGD